MTTDTWLGVVLVALNVTQTIALAYIGSRSRQRRSSDAPDTPGSASD